MNNEKDYIECANQKVYVKHGITYVPHYSKPGIFVGPGWAGKTISPKGHAVYHPNEYTEEQLIDAGAGVSEMFLWVRDED